MSPLDALWHLLNLLVMPLGVSALASALAWVVWGRVRSGVSWLGLAAWSFPSAILAYLVAWQITGAEGSQLGYALMVAGVALMLWWRLFLA